MFNKLLIFICLIVALNFLFLNCDGEPNSTSNDSSDTSSSVIPVQIVFITNTTESINTTIYSNTNYTSNQVVVTIVNYSTNQIYYPSSIKNTITNSVDYNIYQAGTNQTAITTNTFLSTNVVNSLTNIITYSNYIVVENLISNVYSDSINIPAITNTNHINAYIIHSLLLENTNASPSDPITLRELEVYSGSTDSGSNVILYSTNTSSGTTLSESPITNLVDGLINMDETSDVYHSLRSSMLVDNWASVGFNIPIIVDENQATNIFMKLYGRNKQSQQPRAVGIKIHLFDTSNNIVLSSGGITSGAASYDFLYNFSTSTVTID